jgi:hypothetical protein
MVRAGNPAHPETFGDRPRLRMTPSGGVFNEANFPMRCDLPTVWIGNARAATGMQDHRLAVSPNHEAFPHQSEGSELSRFGSGCSLNQACA